MDAALDTLVYEIQEIVAFRKEGVDAASCKEWGYGCGLVSPSARKVWMLQTVFVKQGWQEPVAFRKEGVDAALFALLVDVRLPAVAFRKEGVDAALPVMTLRFRLTGSPSARKVWMLQLLSVILS